MTIISKVTSQKNVTAICREREGLTELFVVRLDVLLVELDVLIVRVEDFDVEPVRRGSQHLIQKTPTETHLRVSELHFVT